MRQIANSYSCRLVVFCQNPNPVSFSLLCITAIKTKARLSSCLTLGGGGWKTSCNLTSQGRICVFSLLHVNQTSQGFHSTTATKKSQGFVMCNTSPEKNDYERWQVENQKEPFALSAESKSIQKELHQNSFIYFYLHQWYFSTDN